jgi:FtsP/CotA-like multicopper oxidase with cupredoxin domain
MTQNQPPSAGTPSPPTKPTTPTALTRRELLKLAGSAATLAVGVTTAGLAARALGAGPTETQSVKPTPGLLRFRLTATPGLTQLRPGAPTPVWRFRHRLIEGNPAYLTQGPAFLGPTIRVPRGTRIVCDYTNNLPEISNVHWHGLDVPSDQDGHPKDFVNPGATRRYDFVVDQPAGTNWYHPHPDMLTGKQAYMGLAGLFIVTDKDEARCNLPSTELPLVLTDRLFDASNQLVYGDPSGVVGMLGNVVLVNGQQLPTFALPAGPVRLRLLNASNSRIYKLAFTDATPITIIATDGSLLPQAVNRGYLMLSPGERADVWLDLSARDNASTLTLRSLSFNPIMMGSGSLTNGAQFDVCRFQTTTPPSAAKSPPTTLVPSERYLLANAANAASPRLYPIGRDTTTNPDLCQPCWTLNGELYSLAALAPNESVPADTLELVQIDNPANGPVMPHPIHFHGRPFQVLSRARVTGNASTQASYNTINAGLVDSGWKDTVLLWPGERVQLLVKWSTHRGLFVYHCHNLEHEDMGMMRNLRVV